jgi:putative FmdB family regulatory protein
LPTYGYECTRCKERFEVIQKITDAPLQEHDGCGGEVRRLLYPVGIVFKGPGFHVNDYSRSGRNGSESKKEDGAATTAAPASESRTQSKTDTKTEAKPETKPVAATD